MLRPFPSSRTLECSILAHVYLHILQTQEVRRFTYEIKRQQTNKHLSQILGNVTFPSVVKCLLEPGTQDEPSSKWTFQRYRSIPSPRPNRHWLARLDTGWLWPGGGSCQQAANLIVSRQRSLTKSAIDHLSMIIQPDSKRQAFKWKEDEHPANLNVLFNSTMSGFKCHRTWR